MRNLMIAAAFAAAASSAFAVQATWTGSREQGRSVSGQLIYICEYRVFGTMNTFKKAFPLDQGCPYNIEVY